MAQKHFVIIFDDFLPGSVKFGSQMMQDLALSLQSAGHTISVITPGKKNEVIDFQGIDVLTFRTGEYKNTSRAMRLINELRMSQLAFTAHRRQLLDMKVDGIIYYSPTVFFHPLIRKLKTKWGCKAYLVLRDIFPQWAIDTGILKDGSPVTRFLKHHERRNYAAADVVGLQTPNNIDFFKSQFDEKFPTDLLYNWVSPSPRQTTDAGYPSLRTTLGLSDDDIIFFYGGNLGVAQNIAEFAQLAANLRDDSSIKFVFLGKGDLEDQVREICNGAPHCFFHGPVPSDHYAQMLTEADVGLISLDIRNTTHNVPGKTLNYLSQGIPIAGIVNPGNDLMTMINGEAGQLIDTFDADTFKDIILNIKTNKANYVAGCKRVLDAHFDTAIAHATIQRYFDAA